jgi:hypothetical protein
VGGGPPGVRRAAWPDLKAHPATLSGFLGHAAAATAGRAYELQAGIGLAMLEAGDTLDGLLAKADADLYTRKKASPIKAGSRQPSQTLSPPPSSSVPNT